MSEPQFGQLVTDATSYRDAIHVATVAVTASERLYPGQKIGLAEGSSEVVTANAKPIGIVDPFLPAPVEKDQRFWLFLFPRSTTGLRHVWSHPAFPDVATPVPDADGSGRRWLTDFASRNDIDVEALIQMGRYAVENDYVFSVGSSENLGDELQAQAADFWWNWTLVTGIPVRPTAAQNTYYRCSC